MPTGTIQINTNVTGIATDVPYIRSDGNGVYIGEFDPVSPWRVIFRLPAVTPPAGWGADVHWGNKSERFVVPSRAGAYESELLTPIPFGPLVYESIPPIKPLPPVPSREAVCGINLTFQGLAMNLTYASLPWFELGFQCQNEENRQIVYNTKRLAKDTHLILQFQNNRPVYNSPDEQPYKYMYSPDYTADPQSFFQLVREVIVNGFIPVVVFDGDNADNEPYGSANALRQLPVLSDIFHQENLWEYILFARFWDGVFYGSSPSNITYFGDQFRRYFPMGYLAIMHNAGHIPVGGGTSDYQLSGAMRDYDVVVSQFEQNLHQDSTWQIAARLLGPAYRRPSDQPAGDDPTPPFYLIDSGRGPRYTCALEWVGEYLWVRNRTTPIEVQEQRNYLKSIGYTYLG